MSELPISMDDSKVTPVEAQAVPPELNEVLEFLYGAAPMDGKWWSEGAPWGQPRYWWRSKLRNAIKAAFTRPTPAAADLHQQSHSVHLAGDEAGRTSVEGGVNAPSAEVPEHFIAQLRDAARYLLQNGQTKQGLAVQACVTMLEDDSND